MECGQFFLRKAGTIILGTSLVLWALLNLPLREAETRGLSPTDAGAYVMNHSYAADVGRAIEPVFRPLGFDWRTDVALVGSLSAREVFVSTLGQVSAATDPANPRQALATMTDDHGHRVFTAPTVIALMTYFMFALQCMSTGRRDAPRDQLVAVAGLRVLLHVCPGMGDGVRRPVDCDRPGRMIPIHATATANPQQLRWVVAADRLPPAGTVHQAPGRLGALLDGGVIDEMVVRTTDILITLRAGNSWRGAGR